MDTLLTIVITTHDRPVLLNRSISSILDQLDNESDVEIIVVDDASSTSYAGYIPKLVTYYRMDVNKGPGPARMQGLSMASGKWVLMLDDDDTMTEGAIVYLLNFLKDVDNKYPVIQMARTNGRLSGEDRVINFSDYMAGMVSGEFTPIFNKEITIRESITYPDNIAGGEHILWWDISKRFGLPTYSRIIVDLHADSDIRMTDSSSQVSKSAAHLELAQITLDKFGKELKESYPAEYNRLCLAKASYSLLSGKRKDALSFINKSPLSKKIKISFFALSLLPTKVVKFLFLKYREKGKK